MELTVLTVVMSFQDAIYAQTVRNAHNARWDTFWTVPKNVVYATNKVLDAVNAH